MNELRLILGLDDPMRLQAFSLAVWSVVALIVLYNALFTVPGLLSEGYAWLRFHLRIPPSRGHVRIADYTAQSDVVTVAERDRLDVLIRISDQKARSH